MTTYGLTTTGFVIKTMDVLISSYNATLQAIYGLSINLDNGIMARFVAILCERLAELWELAEAINSSTNPDAATGARLEEVSLITGTIRKDATSSDATLTLTGTNGTTVNVGSRAKTASTGEKFVTLATGLLSALPAWVATTAYVVGDRRTNATRCYVCITAGTSAGSGGPTTTLANITDNTVHWRYMGEGTGAVDVASTCVDTGPIAAISGDINVIDTPVGGWASVINLTDAVPGNDITSDQGLRLLRDAELAQDGSGTADSIRGKILNLSGVTACTVFVNDTDVTDVDGMPPHSVEALVIGGDDQAIRDLLLANVGAGIVTQGNTSGTSVDSEGVSQPIEFTRPTPVLIYVDITYIKYPIDYPSDGDLEVQTAIALITSTGTDAVASRIGSKAFGVAGVLDVTSTKIGIAPAPTLSTTISITPRQYASYDTSRVTVHTSDGTP